MRKKTVLVTGGSGFIGKNITERLGSKYDISVPLRNELDLMDAVAVGAYLRERQFDVVIHCANIGGNRKTGVANIYDVNVRTFTNIASYSKSFGRFIQLGSGAEYDKRRPLVRVREEEFGKRVPVDEYGRYKYDCSKYIDGEKNTVCLRIFGCYGKYEDYETRFISNAICKSLFGLPITISNKNVVFSYIYINDFVRIVDHFINHESAHKFYNAVPDETYDLLSIAQKVKAISGNKMPLIVKNPGMGNEYTGDNSRLRAEIPGFRFTSLDKGIRDLYSWYVENKGKIEYEKIASDRY